LIAARIFSKSIFPNVGIISNEAFNAEDSEAVEAFAYSEQTVSCSVVVDAPL